MWAPPADGAPALSGGHRKDERRMLGLVARPPSVRAAAFAGVAIALLLAVLVGPQTAGSVADALRGIARELLTDLAAVAVVVALLGAATRLMPGRGRAVPAPALSLGVYALAGAAGGVARAALQALADLDQVALPVALVADALAGAGAFALVGAVVGQLDALRARARDQQQALRDQIAVLERQAAQLDLQARTLDLAHDCIIVRDLAGTIRWWNRGAEETLGWTRAEAVGQNAFSLLWTALPLPLDQIMAELERTGVWQGEIAHIDRQGRRVAVRAYWALQRDDRGQPTGVIELSTDITERGRLLDRVAAQQQQLREQVQDLQRSREQIITAEENLRREIAEMLHGTVQTRLLLVWHRLGQAISLLDTDPEQARRLLAEARDDIDDIREREVRQASHLLHPAIIRVGLLPALRSLADRYSERFQVSVRTDPALTRLDDPTQNRIPERLRLIAYRIAEEALSNVDRHARAGRVEIGLRAVGDTGIEIEVWDDGQGFDPERTEPGLGLSTIAARVGQAGGIWRITSAPGQGTRLSAYLPLTPPE
jgi:PAS domain S-box-containing protein